MSPSQIQLTNSLNKTEFAVIIFFNVVLVLKGLFLKNILWSLYRTAQVRKLIIVYAGKDGQLSLHICAAWSDISLSSESISANTQFRNNVGSTSLRCQLN